MVEQVPNAAPAEEEKKQAAKVSKILSMLNLFVLIERQDPSDGGLS